MFWIDKNHFYNSGIRNDNIKALFWLLFVFIFLFCFLFSSVKFLILAFISPFLFDFLKKNIFVLVPHFRFVSVTLYALFFLRWLVHCKSLKFDLETHASQLDPFISAYIYLVWRKGVVIQAIKNNINKKPFKTNLPFTQTICLQSTDH